MNRKSELVKNTAIISLGTILPKGISILLLPLLTGCLTVEEFGEYDLVLTFSSLLLPAVTMQISSGAFRFLVDCREKKDDCACIISTTLFFVFIISFPCCVIYAYLYGTIIGVYAAVYFLITIALSTCQQIARGVGDNLNYSISAVVFSSLTIILIIVLFTVTYSNLAVVLFSMITASLASFFILAYNIKLLYYIDFKNISYFWLKRLIIYSFPLELNNISDWILALSDRLIITYFIGIEANAIYAVANKLPVIFSSFQTTFSLAWQENASIAARDEDSEKYYTEMCDWMYSLMFGLMAIVITITPLLWQILIRGGYSESYAQLPILYMGVLFSSMSATLGGIYIAQMMTFPSGIGAMISAGVNLFIDLILINEIGIWAGSISTLVSYIVLFLFRAIYIRSFCKIKFKIKRIITGITLVSCMGGLCYQNNIATDVLNVFLCIIVLIKFDLEIINSFWKIIVLRIRR